MVGDKNPPMLAKRFAIPITVPAKNKCRDLFEEHPTSFSSQSELFLTKILAAFENLEKILSSLEIEEHIFNYLLIF